MYIKRVVKLVREQIGSGSNQSAGKCIEKCLKTLKTRENKSETFPDVLRKL